MDMRMQHGHEHAAWTSTHCMGIDIWYSMDMNMQHGLGHIAWTWIMDTNVDMQYVQYLSMSMQHDHGHAACPSPAACLGSLLRVNSCQQHVYVIVHVALSCPCCMPRMSTSMLYVYVHAECSVTLL
jgi:hypothetical protein